MPNEDSLNFFSEVCGHLDSFSNLHKIIAGDLNLCFDIDNDKRGTMYNNIKALEVLNLYMEENCMIDVWRMKNPKVFAFTWKRQAPIAVMSRLDYFLVTMGTVGWIDNIYIKPGLKSDHSVIGIELYPGNINRGRGFWKFNILLVDDEEFGNNLRIKINNCIEQNSSLNLNDLWENIKLSIASFSGQYAADKSRNTIKRLNELKNELQKLIKHQCFSVKDMSNRQEQIRSEIEKFYGTRTKGSMFHPKVRWYKEGEKNTKIFYRLESNVIAIK